MRGPGGSGHRARIARAARVAGSSGALGMVALVLSLAVSQPGAASATCYRVAGSKHAECFGKSHEPKAVELTIDMEGHYVFGREQNGVDHISCGDGSTSTPNHERTELTVEFHLDWQHVIVPIGPVRKARHVEAYESNPTEEVVGAYRFSGFAYDENCKQVSWPGEGSGSCEGMFKPNNDVKSLLFVNLPVTPKPDADHVNVEIAPISLPSQGLNVAPAGCNDNGSPPAFHTFAAAYGESVLAPDTHLSLDVARSGHGVGAYSFAKQSNAPGRVVLPGGFVNNCGEPAAELTCTQGWDPPDAEEESGHGEVLIEREKLIK
jgi:hypothetical protein